MFVHAEERVYAAMIEQIDAERDGGHIDWSIIQKVSAAPRWLITNMSVITDMLQLTDMLAYVVARPFCRQSIML